MNNPSSSRFLAAEWEGECVVFNRSDGSTHALDKLSSALWQMPRGILDNASAMTELHERFDLPREALQEAVDESLAKLDHLGLL